MLDKPVMVQMSTETRHLLAKLDIIAEHITASLDSRCFIVHMSHLSRMEMESSVGLTQGDMHAARELISDYVMPDLKDSLLKRGIELESIYFDWDDHNFSGMIVGLLKGTPYREHEDYYRGKDGVHHQITKITYEVQKVPDHVYSFWAAPNILIIIREGLFIKIEKELLKYGFEYSLRTAKRALEREYFLNEGRIAEILNRRQAGLYLDWQFQQDKSVLVYRFEEQETG